MKTDAISRSAVLALTNIITVKGIDFRCIFPEEVKHLPILDVAPVVHARWILEESPFAEHEEAYDGESHDRYVCSRCRCEAGFGCDADGFATDQNLDGWCSSCGARMDGEAE